MRPVLFILLLWIHLAIVLGYVPKDNYLIDCGSYIDNTVGDRTFSADNVSSDILSTSRSILVYTNTSSAVSAYYESSLFLTARVFESMSRYKFPIQEKGWHFIRLYFFPFVSGKYNLSTAEFSVSAQNVTILRNFRIASGAVVKEFCFNVSFDDIVLSFAPASGSFAFLNALEIISIPQEVIPDGAQGIDTPGNLYRSFRDRAFETVARVNMGNKMVLPRNDSLWRLWESDSASRRLDLVVFVDKPDAVVYESGGPTENIAPVSVYGTVTSADTDKDPFFSANLTWLYQVDPGFEYLVRFHFCDILNSSVGPFLFNVYVNSRSAYNGLNLGNLAPASSPFYFDVVSRPTDQGVMAVRLGPSPDTPYPMVILNGLEIMKLSSSRKSLDASDADIGSSGSRPGKKIVIVISSVVVISVVATVLVALALFLTCQKRRKLAMVGHAKEEDRFGQDHKDHETGISVISSSKVGYKFPFAAIEEATDKFSESFVIGVGGFGKVYKGVLRDGTKVAVKRGSGKSDEGLQEFRTEVEMLSQFRHRHLVSLIGYCHERDEMIIIYEFMENGTVKDHLYGNGFPVLSWRQRLRICIGSAKGLHYLHTGTAQAIIHRDVKSANILLDDSLMAKVADFGLSKAGPDLNKTHVSTAVRGSFGYLDPEYLTRQQLTEKSDVYSFGVVMLEVLSGRPVIDPSRARDEVNLVEWAMKWKIRGKLDGVVDPRIVGQMKDGSLLKFVEIAEKCLAECGADRPTMGDVLWNLECALELEAKDDNASLSPSPSPSPGFLSAISRSEISVSLNPEYSIGTMGDLAGVSMSKVFANMVKEEMM